MEYTGLAEGTPIGPYVVRQRLGAGGMGEVYLAEHRNIDRKAAIKLLLPEFSSNADIVARFFNEARAASRIKHPGIVEILDCDIHATGRAYIVMEYLEGENLGQCITRVGRLDATSALGVLAEIARALDAAHAKSIVHRDLKPDNIFLATEDGRPPVVKVLDFGIAKLAADGDKGQTKTGNLLGTPLYMSPEQCRGAGKVDFRTDIYSLGCIAFELLSGRPPFIRDGAGELLVAHLTETPVALSSLVPSISPDIGALVASMLEKDAARRPPSMAAIVQQIERLSPEAAGPTPFVPSAVRISGAGAEARSGANVASAPGVRASIAGVRASAAGSAPVSGATAAAKADTTFGQSAAEVVDLDALPRTGRRGLFIGAAIVVVVGAGALLLRATHRNEAASAPIAQAAATAAPPPAEHPAPAVAPPAALAAAKTAAPAAAPKRPIEFEITSTPPGAEVWIAGEDASRGRTPLKLARGAGTPSTHAVLKLPGFSDGPVSIDPAGETKLTVTLAKLPKARPHHDGAKSAGNAGVTYRPMGD